MTAPVQRHEPSDGQLMATLKATADWAYKLGASEAAAAVDEAIKRLMPTTGEARAVLIERCATRLRRIPRRAASNEADRQQLREWAELVLVEAGLIEREET